MTASEVPQHLLGLEVVKSERKPTRRGFGFAKQERGEQADIDAENARSVGSDFEKVLSLPADEQLNGLRGVLTAALYGACSPLLTPQPLRSAIGGIPRVLSRADRPRSGTSTRTPRALSYPDIASSQFSLGSISPTYTLFVG